MHSVHCVALTLVKHKEPVLYAALKYYISKKPSNRVNGRVRECVKQNADINAAGRHTLPMNTALEGGICRHSIVTFVACV
jgi:hypothetical protein